MSILEWFSNKKLTKNAEKLNIPGKLWVKCPSCNEVLYEKDLTKNKRVCNNCGYHFRLNPKQRIEMIFDKDSFVESDLNIEPTDFLKFKDTKSYQDRIDEARKKTSFNDAVRVGVAKLNGVDVNVGVMDFFFMGGSMGSVVGEKITRLIERACENKYPLLIFSSSGGARMQEGILSLMQMAKTTAALQKLSKESVPYISIICDPTTGGTSASFSLLGDINMSEPGALISFAGPRVIEQTIRQKVPKGFQRAEFLLEHGMLDKVVKRSEMKSVLTEFISILNAHRVKG